MADTKTTSTTKPAGIPASDAGTRLEQATHRTGETSTTFKDAHEKGFFGEKVDPTPNEHYTAGDPHTDPPAFHGPDAK